MWNKFNGSRTNSEDQCSYVVVRNAAHSDSFAIFESSEVRALLNGKLGAREISMSRCRTGWSRRSTRRT